MNWAARLQNAWYAQRRLSPALWLLLPLHGLFVLLSASRRLAYQFGLLPTVRLPVPVLVVGNLVVGGVGKTPLVLWLAQEMQHRGFSPAIISRGYGGAAKGPRAATTETGADEVGDEALMLARQSGLPVWVGADRVAVAKALLAAHPEVNLLISDDGLQHYRLVRDAELVVFDGRGAGNGWRLPLGPLREPLWRLRGVSALVFNGAVSEPICQAANAVPSFAMCLTAGALYRLDDPGVSCLPAALMGKPLHAVAGIGNPERFFSTLRGLGLDFQAHPFPDHHAYSAADLDFGAGSVLLMTEKDAVKCAALRCGEAWVLPVRAQLPVELVDTVLESINGQQTT